VRTATVVRCSAGWEARCYYSAEEYHASVMTSRESAEADAFAHTIRLADPGDEHAPG